jgi:hypothetical protein
VDLRRAMALQSLKLLLSQSMQYLCRQFIADPHEYWGFLSSSRATIFIRPHAECGHQKIDLIFARQ